MKNKKHMMKGGMMMASAEMKKMMDKSKGKKMSKKSMKSKK